MIIFSTILLGSLEKSGKGGICPRIINLILKSCYFGSIIQYILAILEEFIIKMQIVDLL